MCKFEIVFKTWQKRLFRLKPNHPPETVHWDWRKIILLQSARDKKNA